MSGAPELSRICIVGTSGCGKSTVGGQIGAILDVPHVQLDSLHWMDDWVERDDPAFAALVAEQVGRNAWVIDGNYSVVRDLVWARAELVIWLDLPRRVVWRRVIWRSVRRALDGTRLWGTNNAENLRRSFLSRDSVVWWSISTFSRRRREYGALFESSPLEFVRVRLRSSRQVREFVAEMAAKNNKSAA